MDPSFFKGVGFSLVLLLSYNIYVNYKIDYDHKLEIIDSTLREIETRIDNLEDFKFRFYQMYTSSGTGARVWNEWDDMSSDLYSSEEEESE